MLFQQMNESPFAEQYCGRVERSVMRLPEDVRMSDRDHFPRVGIGHTWNFNTI